MDRQVVAELRDELSSALAQNERLRDRVAEIVLERERLRQSHARLYGSIELHMRACEKVLHELRKTQSANARHVKIINALKSTRWSSRKELMEQLATLMEQKLLAEEKLRRDQYGWMEDLYYGDATLPASDRALLRRLVNEASG